MFCWARPNDWFSVRYYCFAQNITKPSDEVRLCDAYARCHCRRFFVRPASRIRNNFCTMNRAQWHNIHTNAFHSRFYRKLVYPNRIKLIKMWLRKTCSCARRAMNKEIKTYMSCVLFSWSIFFRGFCWLYRLRERSLRLLLPSSSSSLSPSSLTTCFVVVVFFCFASKSGRNRMSAHSRIKNISTNTISIWIVSRETRYFFSDFFSSLISQLYISALQFYRSLYI